ncbi:MAG: energy transducer TonB [Saprospiraceae bacterium]|nr:energy transducer TonB [Bacteroidia bacterium]NNF20853.1 energy transducer TonB [Saprospiraceae bacterium]NNK89098.1 energy transducer TonB [Saprospiraceae bacterium]
MSKERKDKHFIKKPVYPGGTAAFKAFIKNNLKYPKEALKNKTEGTVLVKYDIDYKGNVTDARVMHSLGDGCDEEAVRVIKLLKFDIPKGPRKLKVLFHKEAKITFKLPVKKKKPVVANQKISYKVTVSKNPETKKENNKTNSYSYTIKW